MNLLNYIVSPVAGAVIGYITNWLAIKMLFFPCEEKYILKKKIPFTPGLIPKERYRLSNKIGAVAGEYVLTSETMEEYINNAENKEKILNVINKFLSSIENSDKNLDDIFETLFGENKNIIFNNIDEFIKDKICLIINNEKLSSYIVESVCNKIIYLMKNYNEFIDKDKIFDYIQEMAVTKGSEYIFSQKFKDDFNNIVTEKKISDYISENNIYNFKKKLYENIPVISDKIVNYIDENKELDDKFRELTKNVINENVGTIAGLFINSDKVYLSIKNGLFKYLKSYENQENFYYKICDYIDLYYNSEINLLIEKIPLEFRNNITSNIDKEKFNNIILKFITYIKDEINKNELNLFDIILKAEPNFIEKINTSILNLWNNNLKNEFLKYIYLNIEKGEKNLLDLKVKSLYEKLPFKNTDLVDKYTDKIISFITNKGGKFIIENLNMPNIIENKINSFEIEIIEDILLSVAKKELNAITYVGGVLGFIIGLVPVFMQFIS